jgi:hypothetical protein
MSDQKKEPLIAKSSRPTAVDYDAPLSGMKVSDLLGVLSAHSAQQAHFYEFYKPEFYKPEFYKPDYFKPPEYVKELKTETVKEKEFVTPTSPDPIEDLANRVAAKLKSK